MNIIYVLHSHDCGGAEMHALQMMEATQQRGHKVTYAGPADSWLADHALKSGIATLDIPLHGLFDLYSLIRLVRHAKETGADILHGHLTRGAFYAGIAAKLAGIYAISTAHSTNTHKHFNYSRTIIAVSGAVQSNLTAKGYSPEKIVTIYNGIPDEYDISPAHRTQIRQDLGIQPCDLALCMVARFIPDKGHDLLLDALSHLRNYPIRLFMIGKAQGAWYETVAKQARSFMVDGNVRFLGHRDDVSQLLPGMDIFVAPSRREAISLSILEACACSLPLLAARVGGIPEAIRDGENGLLIERDDVAGLTTALKRLCDDEALRQRLGSNARATYLQRFSFVTMVDKTLEQYMKLCQ